MEFHEAERLTPEGQQKIAFVDIDETICFYSDKRRYDLSEPDYDNIAKINKMFDEGWNIKYMTARGITSGIDYYALTNNQLVIWGCKFHELVSGDQKPHFDLVIDDKAKRIEEL